MPDFFNLKTVAWEKGEVRLIDQTKLPNRLVYMNCRNHLEIAGAIKNMVVRGAPAIGVASAMGMALAAVNSKAKTKSDLIKDLKHAKRVLEKSRPTAVNLSWAIQKMINFARSVRGEPELIVNAIVEKAKSMAEEDFETNREIGRYGATLLRDGDVVLTHCN